MRTVEEVFGIEPASAVLVSPSDAYKERVRAALEEHAERAQRRAQKPGDKPVTLDEFFGIGDKPERRKQTDLNEPARNWMKAQGWNFERVDYYDARTTRHHDFLGMFDYLAFTASGETVGVQITSRGQISARRNKILAEKRLDWVRRAGWRAVVLGFDKDNPNGGRWRCKEEWIL